jgi:hypothetical protein
MAQFLRENLYNQSTTIQPLISPFLKIAHLISVLITVAYGKVKIFRRIQWPMLKAKGWQRFQATSPLDVLDVFLVGLVERIHINSRRVKAFYGTIRV